MALIVMQPRKSRMMPFVVRISHSFFSCHAKGDSCVSICLCTDLGQSLGVILLSNMYGFCIHDRLLSYMTQVRKKCLEDLEFIVMILAILAAILVAR